MWQKKESKLELAASMIRQVMPQFSGRKNVIILCDSWYVKMNLVSIVDEYENLDLVGNARSDSAIYDLPSQRTGKKRTPAGILCHFREKYRNQHKIQNNNECLKAVNSAVRVSSIKVVKSCNYQKIENLR